MSEDEIQEIRKNIKYWEDEKQKYLNKNDIMSAVQCEILAENLREEIGESKYE